MASARPDDGEAAKRDPCPADYRDGGPETAGAKVLNARLRQLDARKRVLERKAAEHNRNRAELAELQAQLSDLNRTAEDARENERQASDSVSRDFSALSSKRDRAACAVDRLRRENHELQCGIHAMTSLQLRTVDEIQKLEAAKKTAAECVRELRDGIREELDRLEALKRELVELENGIAIAAAETDRFRCELGIAEQTVLNRRGEVAELERLNAEQGRMLSELTAECRARVAEQDALRADEVDRLARLDESAVAVSEELMVARAVLDRAKAEGARAADAYRRLKEAGNEEACRARAELRDRAEERDRLSERLAVAEERLAAALDERERAANVAREQADRLAAVTAEVEKLERRARHEQLVLKVMRVQRETETALFGDEKTAKGYTLELLEAELEELRKMAGWQEQAVQCAAEPNSLAVADTAAACGVGSGA